MSDIPRQVTVPQPSPSVLDTAMQKVQGFLGQFHETCDPSAIIGPSAVATFCVDEAPVAAFRHKKRPSPESTRPTTMEHRQEPPAGSSSSTLPPYDDLLGQASLLTSDMERLRADLERMRTENTILLDQLAAVESTYAQIAAGGGV